MSQARISFYVLSGSEQRTRLSYACRLMEKAWKLQHRIHAHADDGSMARALDELLWTFRQGSFVPHEILAANGQPLAPITIGAAEIAAGEPPPADLLVNLATEVPPFFDRFPRIVEIIDGTAAGRTAGRARHRFYRDHGLEPETHEVS